MIEPPKIPVQSEIATTTDLPEDIDRALEELLPAMEIDGGGAVVTSFQTGVLRLRLTGTCEFCPSQKLSAAALASNLRRLVPTLEKIIVEHATGSISIDSTD